jgi:hypothetical protein
MERREFLTGSLFGAGAFGLALTSLDWMSCGALGAVAVKGRWQVFSSDEGETLSAVAGRIVAPLDAQELAVAAKIDSLLAGADIDTQTDFKRLLWLFDTVFAALFFEGRLSRFRDLGVEEQDRVLGSWRDSHLPFRRSGFQALQRLCLAVAYATPSVYPGIGYPGPPRLVRPDGSTAGGMPQP